MSTILDALKKIESEKRRELPERGLLDQVAKIELSRPVASIRPWKKGALVILLCTAVSVMTLVFYRFFTRTQPPSLSPAPTLTTGTNDLKKGPHDPAQKEGADINVSERQAIGYDIDEGSAESSDLPDVQTPYKDTFTSTVTHDYPPPGLDLKINAIVWSKDPKARFAMVNQRSVRKGDEVNGAIVVEIKPDWIIFDYRGEQFQVMIKE